MSVLRRLYHGDTNVDFIGHRKRWYLASAILLLVCIGSMAFRGFNFGIEFAGGNQFQVPVKAGTSLEQVQKAAEGAGVEVAAAQEAGVGDNRAYVIRTPEITPEQSTKVVDEIAKAAEVTPSDVAASEVSSSWGGDVTNKALIGLGVFLVLVGAYLWIRFEQKMAIAALAALVHDLVLTAGVYSLVGFEVTPGTIIGLLTILRFSLYDPVVVFDKVEENARGLLGQSRYTFADVANRAVNQTLMRSINTSLIALLPVAGLLFVGAGLLGVGTLKDLALVLFVGMLTGAYSSLFLATPWLVDLKYLDSRYKQHAQRVLSRRVSGAPAGRVRGTDQPAVEGVEVTQPGPADVESTGPTGDTLAGVGGTAPRPGVKPAARRRPGGTSGGAPRPGTTRSGGKRR